MYALFRFEVSDRLHVDRTPGLNVCLWFKPTWTNDGPVSSLVANVGLNDEREMTEVFVLKNELRFSPSDCDLLIRAAAQAGWNPVMIENMAMAGIHWRFFDAWLSDQVGVLPARPVVRRVTSLLCERFPSRSV
ncbi:MAG TPA: hypothetical protein VF624_15250 [Tepidisphaeraceae bacterium]|jgi:hypothetical protein